MTDTRAALVWSGLCAGAVRAAAAYEHEQAVYGADVVRELQQMSVTTPWSRQTWLDAWAHSRAYRLAARREETADVVAWLDAIRRLAEIVSVPDAVRLLNVSESGYGD